MEVFGAPAEGREWCRGSARFAAEHWVHSHPSGSFCDLHNDVKHQYGYASIPNRSNWTMMLRSAPRFSLADGQHVLHYTDCGCGLNSTLVSTRLEEYATLYGSDPPPGPTWWGWRFLRQNRSVRISRTPIVPRLYRHPNRPSWCVTHSY
jgi:hypothetical protein